MEGYPSFLCFGYLDEAFVTSQCGARLFKTCLQVEWNCSSVFTANSSVVICSFAPSQHFCKGTSLLGLSKRQKEAKETQQVFLTPLPPTMITATHSTYLHEYPQCFLFQCSDRLCIKFLIDPSGVGFPQLGETQVHNGVNFNPVISKQTQHFEYLAPGAINWFCIDSTLQRPSVEDGIFLQLFEQCKCRRWEQGLVC